MSGREVDAAVEPPTKATKREFSSVIGAAYSPSPGSSPPCSPYSRPSPMVGVPFASKPTKLTAPVHIDVGGTQYTSTLETLTKFPESRLAKMFNGSIAIILDTLKQNYFIDRDGVEFGFILNYLRNGNWPLPQEHSKIQRLLTEAKYYELEPLIIELEEILERQDASTSNGSTPKQQHTTRCLTMNVRWERSKEEITLGGETSTLRRNFPELNTAGSSWPEKASLNRLPISEYCELNHVEIMERLVEEGFTVASTSSCVDGAVHIQNFLFVRKT